MEAEDEATRPPRPELSRHPPMNYDVLDAASD